MLVHNFRFSLKLNKAGRTRQKGKVCTIENHFLLIVMKSGSGFGRRDNQNRIPRQHHSPGRYFP